MGTLSSELGPHAERLMPHPRIYADANVPSGIVAHMRTRLGWDVLFVLEENDLRRAPDLKHYQLAQQLRRTLITMDRDFGQVPRFPPTQTAGIVILELGGPASLRLLHDRLHDFLALAATRSIQGELWIVEPGRVRVHLERNRE